MEEGSGCRVGDLQRSQHTVHHFADIEEEARDTKGADETGSQGSLREHVLKIESQSI